jgi:hypothetical protein
MIEAHTAVVLDVLAGGQDRHPRRARTDVLSRPADPHAMLKIANLLPRRPHLPMSGCPQAVGKIIYMPAF